MVTVLVVGVTTQLALGQAGSACPVGLARLLTLAVVIGLLTVAVSVTVELPLAGTLRFIQVVVCPASTVLPLAGVLLLATVAAHTLTVVVAVLLPVQSGGLFVLHPPTGSMTPAGAATVALLLANVAASNGEQASTSATGTSHVHRTTLEIKRPMTRITRL